MEHQKTYTKINGKIVQKASVSKILDLIFWEVFDEIPDFILKKAIDKGNCIHNRAEEYIKNQIQQTCICEKPVKSHNELFIKLIKDLNNLDWNFILQSEIKKELSDLLGIIDLQILGDKKYRIIDFKTNSQIHLKKWKYQLIMYAYLIYESWDIPWEEISLEVWHYHQKHDQTIHKLDMPNQDEIKEIQDAIKLYYKLELEKKEI